MASDRSTVSGLIEAPTRHLRLRRRAALRVSPADAEHPGVYRTTGYESVQQILDDILRSASGVLGAAQAFILVSRSRTVLEVACSRDINPAEVMDVVMNQASQPVSTALRRKIMTAGDLRGCVLRMRDESSEEHTPAVLCVPLDLGPQLSGVLCLMRRDQTRRLSDLDLEIVQALSEQAALAIGAASHSSALTRLRDSLSSFAPAYA